jgi:hypothetical protein
MDWDLVKIILVAFSALTFGVIGIAEVHFHFVDNVPIRIFVDGVDVFHGTSGCASTESIGSSSRIDTNQGIACMFPKQYFAGKNVVITTESK